MGQRDTKKNGTNKLEIGGSAKYSCQNIGKHLPCRQGGAFFHIKTQKWRAFIS